MKYDHFGVMLDCSRNAVMKVSEVKRMIDHLKKMGYNTLELYTEDTYEVEGEPYFGYMRGRYTGAELQEIDEYAKSKGIELIPCIQTLAHLAVLLKHREYACIHDTAGILLIDEPKTYELIDRMFASLAKNFTSRKVNIGMDEAHMVGRGKFLDKYGYQNRYEIILRHLNKVLEIAKKYGFTPHMWSDMFFRPINNGAYHVDENFEIPEDLKAQLPEVELVFWDYYHKVKKGYDDNLSAHKKLGKEVWFAGGAWTWNGFAPLNHLTLLTMKPAMESVVEQRVKNVLITMWGDNGKECSFYGVLPSLYAIRQYAEGNFDEEKIKQGFYELFGIQYDEFTLLDLPNQMEKPFIYADGQELQQNPSKILLYSDPFMGVKDEIYEKLPEIPYACYAKRLQKAGGHVGEYAYVFNTLSRLCKVLSYKARLGVNTRKAYESKNKEWLGRLINDYEQAARQVKAFHESFFELWHKENKPNGWEVHDMRLGGLEKRLKTCKKCLQAYINGETDKIEELEEPLLPIEPKMHMQKNDHLGLITFCAV
ncbi:MAG: beta-N-acetylhexosaminidase [Clostridia bacterium]|nr:beta-N-acetylhexosaminidase [Clostridia bacterium]